MFLSPSRPPLLPVGRAVSVAMDDLSALDTKFPRLLFSLFLPPQFLT